MVKSGLVDMNIYELIVLRYHLHQCTPTSRAASTAPRR